MGNIDESTFMARYSAFNPYRLGNREMGFPTPIGAGDAMAKSLYCGMKPIASWDFDRAKALPTGGVFNLEFSPEGSLLVAACEKKSIQIFDPLTRQRIHSVNAAHSDCVNCVKFLDGRMFATCSDDTTIALWDVRNLQTKIRSLHGHSKWVKNIEFSVKDKLLVTSGLDGSIYTWDINCYTECNLVYQRVFHTSSLMRCRLSPDARQMVMCTTGGLLVIVHDLNLSTLAQDLHGFKPNLYRLMQMSQQVIPIAALHDHLFDTTRKENRVEFVSDFPEGNDATVVSSLQIHPQAWSALSRNISHDDRSEWTCIHDIQPNDGPIIDKSTRDTRTRSHGLRGLPRRILRRRLRPYSQQRPLPVSAHIIATVPMPAPPGDDDDDDDDEDADADATEDDDPAPSTSERQNQREGYREASSPEPGPSSARSAGRSAEPAGLGSTGAAPVAARLAVGLSSIQNDVWEASITIKQHRMLQEMYSRGQVRRSFNMQRITGINTGITPSPQAPGAASPAGPATPAPAPALALAAPAPRPVLSTLPPNNTPSTSGQTEPEKCADEESTRHYIRQNRDRLLYYTEETNEGKGFIKELCYSADGRLVCSPFGRGMRLLALNENCSELPHCVQEYQDARPLVEVGQSLGIHQDLVVSSKFNPRYHMLVTGCLEGKIVWYQPYSGESLY